MAFPTTSLKSRYEAKDETGLSDGNAVSTVTDQSGNGFDLSASAGEEPTYKTGIIGGEAVYRFAGAERADGQLAGPDRETNVTAYSVCFVAQSTAEPSSREFLGAHNFDTNSIVGITAGETASEWGTFMRSSSDTVKEATSGVDTTVACGLLLVWDGSDAYLYRSTGSGFSQIGTEDALTGDVDVKEIWMGDVNDLDNFFNGDIALMAGWVKALDATERSDLADYIDTTYLGAGGGGTTLTADAGSYSISGAAADLERALLMSGDAGSYSISGAAADLHRALLMSGDAGSYSITGSSADLLRALLMSGDAGSYSLTGASADLERALILTADAGSYSISGSAADLLRALILTGDAGSYTLSGAAADLVVSTGTTMTAEAGSYSVSGSQADLLRDLLINGEAGSYSVSGSSADLLRALILTADAGGYTVTGSTADLIRSLVMNANAGVYQVTGSTASLLRDLLMDAEAGAFVISGQDATLTTIGGEVDLEPPFTAVWVDPDRGAVWVAIARDADWTDPARDADWE